MQLMLSSLFNITVIAEWCCFIAAIIFLPRRTGKWRLFIPLLFITILAETVGWYLWNILGKGNNGWIFNINLLINISFSVWMFSTVESLQKVKVKLFLLLFLFIAFAVCNTFFFEGPWVYNRFTDIAGNIILAVISCYFFYTVLNEDAFRNLFRYEYYWFANGLLFYSLGSVVLNVFLNYLWEYHKQTGVNIYGYINYGINVLLYGSFIIAFICRRRNTS